METSADERHYICTSAVEGQENVLAITQRSGGPANQPTAANDNPHAFGRLS